MSTIPELDRLCAAGTFTGATTFLLGNEKNAGKTTLLNYVVSRIRNAGPLGYMSIGVDGERNDAITGAPKPQVIAEAGDWLVTARQALAESVVQADLREVFPFQTVFGAPVLAHVRIGGRIELIGPGSNARVAQVLEAVAAEDIQTVVIDGAYDRVTQVSVARHGTIVYVARATPANLTRVAGEVRRMFLLQSLPVLPEHPERVDASICTLDGALTARAIETLPAGCRTILLGDFSQVFLSEPELRRLLRQVELRFCRAFRFAACIVNLYDLTEKEFRETLNDPAIASHVVFNICTPSAADVPPEVE